MGDSGITEIYRCWARVCARVMLSLGLGLIPGIAAAMQKTVLFNSGWIAEPSVFSYRTAFAQPAAQWRVRFKLTAIGVAQALVSYDEAWQDTAGHTTISVLADGRVQVRQQDGGQRSIYLRSQTRIEAGVIYEARLRFVRAEGMELFVNGQLEASSPEAFGTAATHRPLVLGASCMGCERGLAQPLATKAAGLISLQILGVEPNLMDVVTPVFDNPNSHQIPEARHNVSLSVTPMRVAIGEPFGLSWSAQGARQCLASGHWAGAVPVRGEIKLIARKSQRDFGLTCSVGGGVCGELSFR